MKKIFFLVILLLSFNSSSLLAVLGRETAIFVGYSPSGTDMNDGISMGFDFCFCTREGKTSKLKSVKEKLGWRLSRCSVKRKNEELKNSKIEYNSIESLMSSEYGVNEKISFNFKFLYGLGVYTHNEFSKNKEEYVATSVTPEGEILVGVSYFLTKRVGIGIDLGYSFSKNINRNRENSERFDSSGLITMLNFIGKL
jgi:hypothetical protein